ncbi:unnamed protein product [Calypogeia fissa]
MIMAPQTSDPPLGLVTLSDVRVESPFPELDVELSGVSLRETAYEILVAASGITALSARKKPVKTKTSITSTASRLKKAIIRSKTDRGKDHANRVHRTLGETVRYQMEISEQSDDRIRRALIKAAAQQVNKPVEAMLIPLELLLNITRSQFTDQSEYQQWRLRQLRVLEAGLVLHPANAQADSEDGTLSDRLQQMLVDLAGNSLETGAKNEEWLSLRIVAMSKAGKTQNGESPRAAIHWADGFPLNVHLYECLLSACFDTLDEAVLIDEFDEVLEWIKKTWGILGVNNMLHSVCFMWVLFAQFVKTGETEAELLSAAEEQMKEAAAELKVTLNEDHANSFRSAASTIQEWAEKRLMQYREIYPQGAQGTMAALLSLELTAARVIVEDIQRLSPKSKKKSLANLGSNRVDKYVRASMRAAFAKLTRTSDAKREAFKVGDKPRPAIAVLAEDVGALARDERAKYSPVLQQWHLTAAGVAAAALHSCFGKELQKYTAGITGICQDVVQALQAADQLEMDLVRIAVEDGVNAEDGGKSLIREMLPYEAQTTMNTMSKSWVEEGVGRLVQWADRNVQNEQWNPKATREGYAPSAVEVLRIIEETMDVFFNLPISKEPQYVKRVVAGVDQCVRLYGQSTLAGCGKKERYMPYLPALTRYNKKAFTSKGSWRSVLQLHKTKISSSIGSPSPQGSELPHLCVRINTLNHMSTELKYLEKRLKFGWLKDGTSKGGASGIDSPTNVGVEGRNFREARAELERGVQLMIELASYRVIFYDLNRVFWEGLYAGGVENARISQVIERVDPQLGIIAEIASEQLRNRIVAALMKACLDCLVLVLLAGGPSRAFGVDDADILEDDLIQLKDLFKADGEGLPEDLVENAAAPVRNVLRLFHISSEKLIETLRGSYPDADLRASGRFSKAAPLPRTTGNWSPSDANTILRVLCYRGDDTASQYLKRTFNLPKKLALTQ